MLSHISVVMLPVTITQIQTGRGWSSCVTPLLTRLAVESCSVEMVLGVNTLLAGHMAWRPVDRPTRMAVK